MVRKIIAVSLAALLLFCQAGCRKKSQGSPVVSSIQVTVEDPPFCTRQEYRDPETMQLILNRIRTLGQQFHSDVNPETLAQPVITIALLRSDGSQQQYQLTADRYIRTGHGHWNQANPDKVTQLQLLVRSLPEEAVSYNDT